MSTSDAPLPSQRARSKPGLGCLIYLLGVPVFISVCCLGSQLYNVLQGENIARRLAPPEYPGSRLVQVEQVRIPNTRFEQRTYYTPDNPETVLAYMQQHMPGFTGDRRTHYENYVADQSLPSLIVAVSGPLNYLESGVPGVEVKLDEGEAAGTDITFILSWPDP